MMIDWKLYEVNGKFYKGAPKDGSMRPADLPPFLGQLFAGHLADAGRLVCNCRNDKRPWCPGAQYVFLGPGSGHFRRSNYSERFFRPAADGWYPGRKGESPWPAAPVLVTNCEVFPGQLVAPWPPATPGDRSGHHRARSAPTSLPKSDMGGGINATAVTLRAADLQFLGWS